MAKNEKNIKVVQDNGPRGMVFILTYIGAAVYFVQQADGFWEVVLALLQAAVWPAYLIHRVFEVLNI